MTDSLTPNRLEVAKAFCRSVIWIDDQLNDLSKEIVTKMFRPIANCLSKNGILCHLQGHDLAGSPDDPFGDTSVETTQLIHLAKAADVILLDWHLTTNNGPEEAINLIREIVATGGLRFIVIFTNEAKAVEDFIQAFSGEFTPHGEGYSSSKGQFVQIRLKPDPADEQIGTFADRMVQGIYDMLIEAYPDVLHWTGIELTTRIREQMPSILSSIPSGANVLHYSPPTQIPALHTCKR